MICPRARSCVSSSSFARLRLNGLTPRGYMAVFSKALVAFFVFGAVFLSWTFCPIQLPVKFICLGFVPPECAKELISCASLASLCFLFACFRALIFASVAESEKRLQFPSSLSSGFLLKSGGGAGPSSPSSFLSCALLSRGGRVLPDLSALRLWIGVHRCHLEAVGALWLRGHTLIVGEAPCLVERHRGVFSLIAFVLLREGTRGCLLSLIWGGQRAVWLISLCLILSVFSLHGVAAYHPFTGPDWPIRERTSFQETRDLVLLVSGKVGAHTRDNETDR